MNTYTPLPSIVKCGEFLEALALEWCYSGNTADKVVTGYMLGFVAVPISIAFTPLGIIADWVIAVIEATFLHSQEDRGKEFYKKAITSTGENLSNYMDKILFLPLLPFWVITSVERTSLWKHSPTYYSIRIRNTIENLEHKRYLLTSHLSCYRSTEQEQVKGEICQINAKIDALKQLKKQINSTKATPTSIDSDIKDIKYFLTLLKEGRYVVSMPNSSTYQISYTDKKIDVIPAQLDAQTHQNIKHKQIHRLEREIVKLEELKNKIISTLDLPIPMITITKPNEPPITVTTTSIENSIAKLQNRISLMQKGKYTVSFVTKEGNRSIYKISFQLCAAPVSSYMQQVIKTKQIQTDEEEIARLKELQKQTTSTPVITSTLTLFDEDEDKYFWDDAFNSIQDPIGI